MYKRDITLKYIVKFCLRGVRMRELTPRDVSKIVEKYYDDGPAELKKYFIDKYLWEGMFTKKKNWLS